MDIVIDLQLLIDRKNYSYNLILVIMKYLIKMVYHKLVETTINGVSPVVVIIDIMIKHYNHLELIVSDRSFLFTLKF